MLFWTKEEYLKFADAMMDKPQSYYAFEILYWCGIRMGELLALAPKDFDFEKCTLTINKSYQRLKGRDFITSKKTPSFSVKRCKNILICFMVLKKTKGCFR